MSQSKLQVINPFTEEVAYTLPMATAADLEPLVARARAAFQTWRRSSVAERVALCERFMTAFEAKAESIAGEITEQMGKPRKYALGEVAGMLDRARYMVSIAEQTLADEYLPEKAGFVRYIRHEPRGVVLDVAAWNYPLLIAVNVVVPAVLAGNAVIIKHSSKTPLCGRAFVAAFEAAGAPEGLVQDIIADHAVTDQLIKHPGIDQVSFTGSVRGGQEVSRSAAGRFIPMGLELGGKDPAYVCADAPFDFAVENCVDGAFFNAGQSCCAVERIYVDAAIYDDFVAAYAEKAKAYCVPGDPMFDGTTLGPMATKGASVFLAGQTQHALDLGGRLVVGGSDFSIPEQGWFAAPVVVADAPQQSRLMQEESFGPVIGILKVSGEEEAIRYMNDSPYGLTASIWTMDQERAIRIGEQIETGTFFMNRCDYLDPGLAWTGVKNTGHGISLSILGYQLLTRVKSYHLRLL